MRNILYLTQDEIDELVQKLDFTSRDYVLFRMFQDGDFDEIKTATTIYKRKETAMTNTIRELMKTREKIIDSINNYQTESGLIKPGKDSIFRLMKKELDAFDTVIDFMSDMDFNRV